MRSMLKWVIALAAASIIGFLLYKIACTVNQKTVTDERIARLPVFTFYNLDSTLFTNDSLPDGRSTVIVYFNTGCEHCQYETEQIIKNAGSLQQASFLLASIQPIAELKKFDSTYRLLSYPFIKLLHDKGNVMHHVFGANNVPSIFIYDSNKRLIKKYTGELKIEAIINTVNKE